jgi:hypothetical protein
MDLEDGMEQLNIDMILLEIFVFFLSGLLLSYILILSFLHIFGNELSWQIVAFCELIILFINFHLKTIILYVYFQLLLHFLFTLALFSWLLALFTHDKFDIP